MSGTTNESGALRPDPSKHVRYTRGMVLGVDEFTQEFAYLNGRDAWLARDTLGYGTVSGLKVTTEPDGQAVRVVVTAGVAVSPQGQLIRVCADQCASLNDWIAAHQSELSRHAEGRLATRPDDAVSLYAVLCYRDCPTDPLPIPGEPCRSEEEVMEESRTADDFRLELRFDEPDQREEDVLRAFIAWLAAIEVGEGGDFPSVDEFAAAIREAAAVLSSPPRAPGDFLAGSPPHWLRIRASQASEYMRAAFRVWITDLRPLWRPASLSQGCGCGTIPPADKGAAEPCVLLSRLRVPLRFDAVVGNWSVRFPAHVEVDEKRRPFVMHLRLLQERALWTQPAAITADVIPGSAETARGGPPAALTSPTASMAAAGLTGPGLSGNLTRIVAASWEHDRVAPLVEVERTNGSDLVRGVVVAFGMVDEAGREMLVDVGFGPASDESPASLDVHTFQLFTAEPRGTTGPASRLFHCRVPLRENEGRRVLAELIPVEIVSIDVQRRLVTAAREQAVDAGGRAQAHAAALVFSPGLIDTLNGRELLVEVNGDLVVDFRGLAVDGEFLRGRLPSGNGVEGGTFRSWFRMP